MPCYDPCIDKEEDEEARRLGQAATKAACEMAKYFDAKGNMRRLSISTQKWIAEHAEVDVQTRNKTARRRRCLP